MVVKALDSPYQAGRRGATWRKVKPVHTLDLVVLAAEWGHGRRTGWLSNLHLGARGHDGSFVMVGKTFKGMTDELLRWQTVELQARAIATEGITVHVRPELVVEIALDGVQVSRRYPGGVALRFARVRRYRGDKSAESMPTPSSACRRCCELEVAVRVMTWNLWWRFGPWEQRFEAIARVLVDQQPDVVMLQEVWSDGGDSSAHRLAAASGSPRRAHRRSVRRPSRRGTGFPQRDPQSMAAARRDQSSAATGRRGARPPASARALR